MFQKDSPMFDTSAMFALLKIALAFGIMLFAINRNCSLWLVILLGGVIIGLLFGMGPLRIAETAGRSLVLPEAMALFGVVFFIMLLSSIQSKTGQGRRLVAGLTPYMKSPRLRLAFFPALVGLLSVPGGAIFSCPMVRDVAEGYNIPKRDQVLINYWFRHIWEAVWPLYPGYIMTCVLADIPPSMLWRYTFPSVFFSCFIGWALFLRIPIERLPELAVPETEKRPLHSVLLDALPLVVGIGCAPVFSALFSAFGIDAPGGTAFCFAFALAAVTAMIQDRISPSEIPRLMLTPHVGKMLGLILMVFVFKAILTEARVVEALSVIFSGKSAVLLLALTLPALMGALTGVMLGFVGSAFPLVLAVISQAGMWDERLCWIILCIASGHFGQMVSPMHSCYLVTLEFFHEHLGGTWRPVFFGSVMQICCTGLYAAALYYLVRPLLP